MKSAYFLLLFIGFTACDSLNTSFKIDSVPPAEQKGTACTVDFAKTCWTETMQKVMSCLGEQREGVFSFDKKYCTNDQQMLIDFADPLAMFQRPYDVFSSPIDFRVLSDSKNECLRIHGTRNAFVITLGASGETIFFENDGEQIRFNCLDGQKIQVETKNIEGCTDKFGADAVPGLELDVWKDKKTDVGWALHLRGAGQEPVFRCRF